MRYYEVYYPGSKEPAITSNVRDLKDLPAGTKILRTVAERDGTLADQEEIPIVDGKPAIYRRSKRRPKFIWPL